MVYLIPSELSEGITAPVPAYVLDAVKACTVFFVENERTARRYLKRLWPDMVIDDYGWVALQKGDEQAALQAFSAAIAAGKVVGILSEAGCPGVADPGQVLVARAQEMGAVVRPLTGPSSILLALMASGLNGQSFCFHGYLPVDAHERKKTLQRLSEEALRKGTTHIFIETPYRNEAIYAAVCENCPPTLLFCIGCRLTSPEEWVQTKTIAEWKRGEKPALHKKTAIFLLGRKA